MRQIQAAAGHTVRIGDLDAFRRGDDFRSFNCSEAASSAAKSIASNMDDTELQCIVDRRSVVDRGANPEGEEAAADVVSNVTLCSGRDGCCCFFRISLYCFSISA
jgi:hypothetical protein